MHSLWRSKQITDEILPKLSGTGLSELNKVCYCFNSKGDDFIVKNFHFSAICLPQEKDQMFSRRFYRQSIVFQVLC